jgi:hypothetical protein
MQYNLVSLTKTESKSFMVYRKYTEKTFFPNGGIASEESSAKLAVISAMQVKGNFSKSEERPMKNILEQERDYIMDVFKKCNGRIWGSGAAAELMNILLPH